MVLVLLVVASWASATVIANKYSTPKSSGAQDSLLPILNWAQLLCLLCPFWLVNCPDSHFGFGCFQQLRSVKGHFEGRWVLGCFVMLRQAPNEGQSGFTRFYCSPKPGVSRGSQSSWCLQEASVEGGVALQFGWGRDVLTAWGCWGQPREPELFSGPTDQ